MSPTDTMHPAEALIRRFLAALEARDEAAAGALVAPDTVYVFPGGARRASLAEVLAGSRGRYRHVGKRFERFDVLEADGATIVYCFGTLHGTFADGRVVDGVRFIDRFEVADGRIRRQDVWNDVGQTGPRP